MATRNDLVTELRDQLQAADNSTLYPESRLIKLIQDAYIWATQQFIWRDLVQGKITSTVANGDYYDYPEEFRSDTIIRMEIDGDPYERKNFEDFLDYRQNNPTSTRRIFANYGRWFHVFPTPTSNGSGNLTVWGAIHADDLDSESSETIFSNNKESGNEAVVRKALSVAIRRNDPKLAVSEELAAKGMLAELNQDEWAATHRDKRIQHPKFAVPDFFGSSLSVNRIGRFDYDPSALY